MARIAHDKKKHFVVGIPLGITLQLLCFYAIPGKPMGSTLVCLTVLIVICYGFEVFSLVSKKGHYEIADAVAGIMGGVIGMAITWVYKLFF